MSFSWLWSCFRKPRLAHLHIIVYTRHDCHLCHVAWDQLERERKRHGFMLETVDVDSDPELTLRYGDSIPVVTVDDKERFRGRISDVLLRRLLEASAARGRSKP